MSHAAVLFRCWSFGKLCFCLCFSGVFFNQLVDVIALLIRWKVPRCNPLNPTWKIYLPGHQMLNRKGIIGYFMSRPITTMRNKTKRNNMQTTNYISWVFDDVFFGVYRLKLWISEKFRIGFWCPIFVFRLLESNLQDLDRIWSVSDRIRFIDRPIFLVGAIDRPIYKLHIDRDPYVLWKIFAP